MSSDSSLRRVWRSIAILAVLVATVVVVPIAGTAGAASSGGTLIIGMTASDIPALDTVLAGQQGYEGYRFVGNQLYDGLTRFDLKQSKKIPDVIPALATEWSADATGSTWTFKLRDGVKFTDGTPFDADSVVFNLDRYLNSSSPQYNAALGSLVAISLGTIDSYTAVDPMTVQIVSKVPDSHLPSDMTTVYFGSPTAITKEGNDGFGEKPVGTGPFKVQSVTRGQQLVMVPNKDYWDGAPRLDKLILKPIPDPTTRIAALKSGDVNWIEYPTPDTVPQLESDGFSVLTNSYDHIWPWIFDTKVKPWDDVKVRQAANYAIDRKTMSEVLLHGTAEPADQVVPHANSAYTSADDVYSYNPKKAKQLLKEAGYADGVEATVSIPTSGSGNMIPIPMNEELQHELGKVGIKVTFKPIEWAAMLQQFTGGKVPDGQTAVNISLSFQQESFWALSFLSSSPLNVAGYNNPDVDAALTKAASTVDPDARAKLYQEAAKQITDDAVWLYVVNDKNPRAMSANVKGFVQPKSWFVNLTDTYVTK
ncbi:MAG TPA: ABC transporter substrate-binding protein [Acidimicrobiia bacterium]